MDTSAAKQCLTLQWDMGLTADPLDWLLKLSNPQNDLLMFICSIQKRSFDRNVYFVVKHSSELLFRLINYEVSGHGVAVALQALPAIHLVAYSKESE
jgi:hypothetical protein